SVEGEIPDVEVVQHDVQFPGLPSDAEVSVTAPVTVTMPHFDIPQDLSGSISVREVSLIADSGVPDLSFIRSLGISLTTREAMGRNEPAVEIARYDRSAEQPVGNTLRMSRTPAANIGDLWRATELVMIIEFAGDLPSVAWSADVGIRYAASLKVQ